jgi:phosphoenolpyruvate-protein kinase (PTS system EI component)
VDNPPPQAIGIALAAGGVTSHAAIVARSLGLPMLIALGSEVLDVTDGEEVVIDGDQGILVRSPNAERAASARAGSEQTRAAREVAIARRAEPAITRDGRRVHVLANASTVPELEEAIRQGAEGVGLLRTELLFLEAAAWPTFEQQVGVLKPVLARLAGQVATVRLFDFGADKTPPFLRGITTRGIEVLLDAPEQMRTHLEAVIDAASGAELRILIPMVTDVDQVRAVRRVAGPGVQVGAMIETPEAAHDAFAIARESDFVSIGTNDLTQLALGLDREQSRKAPVMDARVLRLIAETIRAARHASIPVAVCGEAASDAKAMPVMIGFGADELSVAPARVGHVRQWIRELDSAACEKEAARLLHEAGDARGQRV